MKRWMPLFTAIAIVSLVSWGCARTESGSSANTSHGDHGHGAGEHSHDEGVPHDHDGDGKPDHSSHDHGDEAVETVAVALYCGDCGHGFAKGADHKCDADHEVCAKCGLHAGAELCCKVGSDFAGSNLCASCGQVAGTDACCKADAAVCEKCGLHAGAPLCCKLGAKVAPAADAPPADAPAEN